MRSPMKLFHHVLISFLLILPLAGLSAAKDTPSEPRLYEVGAYMAADVARSSAALGAYVIELDPGVVENGAGARELLLPTPAEGVLRARRTSANDEGGGDFVWRGTFGEENAAGRVILTYLNHRMSALILGADRTYEIVPYASKSHLLLELDPALFPECTEPIEPPLAPEVKGRVSPPGTSASVVPTKGVVTIDVLTLYTPQARDAAGGVANIQALIQGAVNVANTAFQDSGSIARFHLVHTALAAHSDAGNMSDDLSWLKSDAAVSILRDLHQADLVSLIVEEGAGSCGVGYVMRNVAPSFAPWAFQVTARSCASANLSYAHEHGHNLGLEHDPANGANPADASYPWSFGHFVNGSFRTVMSYSSECTSSCPRVAHFSNPGVTHNGYATGIANARDNRRTLDVGDSGIGTAMVAAAFRGDDPYEENDTLGTAYDLSSDERTWLGNLAGLGIQSDDDWYKVWVTPGFERMTIDLRFIHSEGDIDVFLYDAGGVPLAGSYSVTDNEYIDYTVPSYGTYYICVYYANAGNSYNLYWDDLPGAYPDLIVPSVTVSDTTPYVGQVVTVGATVRNQGSGTSEATTLRYYGSFDSTIGTDDIELGTDAVGALPPGSSSYPSETFETPAFPGTYWVGACVDAVSESNTGNNCSSGVEITIYDDDLYEENDTLGTAFDLSGFPDMWLSQIWGSAVQKDEDWYRFEVTAPGTRVTVDLRFAHAAGDIDVALYDAGGFFLTGSFSVSDNEWIDTTMSAGGVYYVCVFYGNAGNFYDMRIEGPGLIFLDGFESGSTSAWSGVIP